MRLPRGVTGVDVFDALRVVRNFLAVVEREARIEGDERGNQGVRGELAGVEDHLPRAASRWRTWRYSGDPCTKVMRHEMRCDSK